MIIGNLWGMGSVEHKVIGDTLLNGRGYKIINGYDNSCEYMGFLREDTASGRAWYCSSADTVEALIMDLNLQVGDSMYIGGNWNSKPGFYQVDSVFFKKNRKHLRFNYHIQFLEQQQFVLIEGVTSNLGFRYQDQTYGNNFNPILLCSYKDGIQIFGSGPCEIPFQAVDNRNVRGEPKIYPNPFTDRINIKVNQVNNDLKTFEIIDINGQAVCQGKIESKQINGLENLDCGVYFVLLRDKNGIVQGRIKVLKVQE